MAENKGRGTSHKAPRRENPRLVTGVYALSSSEVEDFFLEPEEEEEEEN
jgi:hypothetical protein